MHTRSASLGSVFDAAGPSRSSRRLAVLQGRLEEALLGRELQAPTRLGRFELIERIGSGGMSTVYLAVDPSLDRRVAIKVLRVSGSDNTDSLIAEARTLARLVHENIVEIFDVGVQEDERSTMFIAMEFVPGQDLARWLRARPPWREALAAMLAAGRGLAAAHAAGVLHGDFKPANVLRSHDGQIKVIDFGLAGLAEHGDAIELGLRRSRRGGTLGYCAPEKLRGRLDTTASDQFSFAVATYQALAGRHPWMARTRQEFLDRVQRGDLPALPRGVPREFGPVLRRGMRPDPRARWPDMVAMMQALESVLEGYPRRRVWIAGTVALTLTLGGSMLLSGSERGCDEAPGFEGWSQAERAEVRERFAQAQPQFVVEGGDKVVSAVDTYVDELAEAQRASCEARRRGDVPPKVANAQVMCLADREQSLERFISALDDSSRLSSAIVGSYRLPRIEPCLDQDRHDERLALSPEAREDADRISKANLDLRATLRAGEYDEGLEVARQLYAEAEALGFEPARVASLNSVGTFLHAKGDLPGAHAAFEAAYFGAQRTQMNVLSLMIATNLVNINESRGDYDEALAWARHAKAVVHRAPDPIVASKLDYAKSIVLQRLGRDDEAQELIEGIIETRKSILGTDHPTTANAVFELGNVHMAKGNYERALQLFEESKVGHERTLGSEHPAIASTYNNMGNLLNYLGREQEAWDSWQRALKIREASLGPDHIALGGTLTNLGSAANARGDHELALTYAQRSLQIREKGIGPSHPMLVGTLTEIGRAHLAEERAALAREAFERAIAIGETSYEHFHPSMVGPLAGAAQAAWAMGDADATIRHAERLVEREEPPLADPTNAADALWVMAQARWALGEHDESRRMASYAIQAYQDSETPDRAANVQAWMEDRDA